MLDKFNLEQIKKQTVDKLSETGDDISSKALTIKSSIANNADSTASKAIEAVSHLKNSLDETKESIKDFGVDKVKDFALNATIIVGEIDAFLLEKNLPYEVGNFRISANMGVMAGMILDINFSKTLNAKKNSFETRESRSTTNENNPNSQQESKTISITNPSTGKSYKIPRASLAGKEQAKIRDPETRQLLVIDVESEKVVKVIEP
jgi:hypothetical protein